MSFPSRAAAAVSAHVSKLREAVAPNIRAEHLSRVLTESASARFSWTILEPTAVTLTLLGITGTLLVLAIKTPDASEAKVAYLTSLKLVGVFALVLLCAALALQAAQRRVLALTKTTPTTAAP
jgi:hypothetical protein